MRLEKLIKCRQEKHLTRKNMAQILGVSIYTYRSYEQGVRKPNVFILKRIAKALECTIDELI
jgi:transcriptional regulator with XRE-family HTH domain